MITDLEIHNFKSIKNLSLQCSKYNLFIGDPNSGKTNIFEALGLLSAIGNQGNLRDFIRFEHIGQLFYDELTDTPIDICFTVNDTSHTISIDLEKDSYIFRSNDNTVNLRRKFVGEGTSFSSEDVKGARMECQRVKYYKFDPKIGEEFSSLRPSKSLEPAKGLNLNNLINSSQYLRELISDIISTFNLNLVIRNTRNPNVKQVEFQKGVKGYIVSFTYQTMSETVKNVINHVAAIISNENTTLVFEEPETKTFPYYTKYLAEKIARDKTNQFFMITHNLLFLKSILEKVKKDEISVFVTYVDNFDTKVKKIKPEHFGDLLDVDPFFNLADFIQEDIY